MGWEQEYTNWGSPASNEYLWVLNMILASCHVPGAKNFEVATTFFENFCNHINNIFIPQRPIYKHPEKNALNKEVY